METMKKIILLAILAIVAVAADAHDFNVGKIYYNITGDNTASVTTYYNNYYYSGIYSGGVTIPKSVTYNGTNYSVTSIGEYAFYNCTGLTSVSIPNSVTSIGKTAFAGCTGLTSVTIPNSVTSIGSDAFKGCTGLTSVEIPNSVKSIYSGAFYDCTSLTSVTLNSDAFVKAHHVDNYLMYDYAFTCKAIFGDQVKCYIIGEGVTSIGSYAFKGCTGLTSITIPNSVKSIGHTAFAGCTGLTSVTIPNSVTIIDDFTFKDCSGLTSIDIPNSVTTIGMNAFAGCTGLTSVTIPNSVTSIGSSAFSGCTGLTSITIPNSVTSIGSYAFGGSGLMSIVVENGNSVYDSRGNCNALIETATNTLITGCQNTLIPNSVTSIERDAFYKCTGLQSVSIPESLTSIGHYAFYGCTGLSRIDAYPNPSKVTMGIKVFYNVPKNGTLHVLPEYLATYKSSAQWKDFYNMQSDLVAGVDDISIEDGDKEVEGYYDLRGIRHQEPVPGLNVVRYNDGTSEKILVK